MNAEILRAENVRIVARTESDDVKVLIEGVDFTLNRGEILGMIGESGAGKTTLGLAALGYMRSGCNLERGRIVFDGLSLRDVPRRVRRRLRGRRIAYVAQSAAASFNPSKTLYTQVCEGPVRHGLMNRAEAKKRAVGLFRSLDLPSPDTFGERYPHQVSGGQLQRAMLAMAMSCSPDVLVFDEPTTALDVTTQIEVLGAIRKLIQDFELAGLYISHDLALVAQVSHRVMVLRNGGCVEEGPTEKVLTQPAAEYTRQLISVRNAQKSTSPRTVVQQGEPVVELSDVSAAYGKIRVVENVNLRVGRGETMAIVGESGSGKSTLARVVCGLGPAATGTVRFRGEVLPPSLRSRTRDQLRRIQMIFQMPDVAVNPRQTVAEILGRPISFYFQIPAKETRHRAEALLQMVDLPADFLSRRPGELSGGQKQRICIARALAAEPDLIICDEITSSLDVLIAEDILKLLVRLQNEMGISYIFITHDLGVVRRMADRVSVMLQGRLVEQGPLEEIFSPPHHPYTETLLASVPEMHVGWLDEALQRSRSRATALRQEMEGGRRAAQRSSKAAMPQGSAQPATAAGEAE